MDNDAWRYLQEVERMVEGRASRKPQVHVVYVIPEDQQPLAPKRRRAPAVMEDVPLPRVGEKVHLSSTSSWSVTDVVHEWRSPIHLVVQVFLSYLGGAHDTREPGFELT